MRAESSTWLFHGSKLSLLIWQYFWAKTASFLPHAAAFQSMLYDLGDQPTDKTLSRVSVPLKTRQSPSCYTYFVQWREGVGFPLLINVRAEAADTEQKFLLLLTETTQSCHKDLTPAARVPGNCACTLGVKQTRNSGGISIYSTLVLIDLSQFRATWKIFSISLSIFDGILIMISFSFKLLLWEVFSEPIFGSVFR